MNKTEYQLIEALSLQETAIANLYAAFSKALPGQHTFWDSLVAEEKAHAEVIWKLAEMSKTKDAQINTKAFNIEAVHTNIAYLEKQTADVQAHGISAIKALSLAVDTERGLIDKQFFRVVQSCNPAFEKEMNAIEEHTSEHLHRIEKHLRAEQGESIQRSLQERQLEVISKLAGNETHLSELYSLYAKSIPEMDAFWNAIARAEATHAAALQELGRGVQTGTVQINIDRFSPAGIDLLANLIMSAITRVKANRIAAKDAILTALSIESSMLDAEFYATVQSDAIPFQEIAQKLASETRQHVNSMQDALAKYVN